MSAGGSEPAGTVDPLTSRYTNLYRNRIIPRAQRYIESDPAEFFPGQTYADPSAQTLGSLAGIEGVAGANQLDVQSSQALGSTLGGDFLGASGQNLIQGAGGASSPYISSIGGFSGDQSPYMSDFANYQDGQNPHLQSMYSQGAENIKADVGSLFAGGGRYGSGAHQDMLTDNLSDFASNLYGSQYQSDMNRGLQAAQAGQSAFDASRNRGLQAATTQQQAFEQQAGRQLDAGATLGGLYGEERGRQMQGLGLAPQTAQMQYLDPQMLGQAGAGYEQIEQMGISEDVARHDFNQNQDLNQLQNWIALTSPQMGGAGIVPTQSSSGGLGGAAGGALMGSQLGSVIPGLGTGVGAVAGGVLGGLGLF